MTTTIEGPDGLKQYLGDLSAERIDFSPVLPEIADDLAKIHEGYFNAEAGPSGDAWPAWYFREPNAPKQHPTLNVTGHLKGSLVSDGSGHVEDIAATSLVWGTSVPYSYQNNVGGVFPVDRLLVGKGGGIKRPGQMITLPQREHVGLNEQNLQPLVEKIADFAAAQYAE